MPELPEVETVARQLAPLLANKEILSISVLDSKLSHLQSSRLRSWSISRVYRLGKQVVFELSKNKKRTYCSVHLRMSGRLIWSDRSSNGDRFLSIFLRGAKDIEGQGKHVRLVFEFSDGILSFIDPRRFGTVLVSSAERDFYGKGVEPLSKDFTHEGLRAMLMNCKQPAKNFLLRQDKLVGLGNIYASEILYLAKIDPRRSTNTLRESESKKLYRAIGSVLTKAIEHCGTTFSDFQHTTGELGSFQNYLRVYGREGKKCRRCKSEILRIVQQQRSSFFCSVCQE